MSGKEKEFIKVNHYVCRNPLDFGGWEELEFFQVILTRKRHPKDGLNKVCLLITFPS